MATGKSKKEPTEESVEMKHIKTTKNTEVYGTDDEDAICKQVYLNKSELPDTAPKKITLTVAY